MLQNRPLFLCQIIRVYTHDHLNVYVYITKSINTAICTANVSTVWRGCKTELVWEKKTSVKSLVISLNGVQILIHVHSYDGICGLYIVLIV